MPIPSNPVELASLQKGKDDYTGLNASEKNGEVAAGGKDVEGLILKIKQATQSNWRVTEEWRQAAEESYNFVENKQWDEKDKKFNDDAKSWRPMMTFNKVLPQVRLLSGMERQNREELRVFPREGGDVQDADIMTSLVKYVLDENLAPWEFTRKSTDVYVCGRGWIRSDISHDENINGDVLIERLNPFSVFWDTMSDKWSGQDMRWCQYGPWLTEDEAKELWPDFADQIDIGDWLSKTDPLEEGMTSGDIHYNKSIFLDEETKRVRALEHWYKHRKLVKIAVNYSTGDVRYAEDEKFQQEFLSLDEMQRQAFQFIDRKMTCVRVATVMHWLLVQDKPSPYKHNMLPLIPYVGLQFMGEPLGIVEYHKDPQRLINKSTSQTLNHLNRSANSGWINKRVGGAEKKELEKFGSMPGIVIDYDEVEPKRMEPASLSTAHMNLAEFGSRMLEEVGLLNAEIQGITTQATTSGRAIEARQRGGMIGNEDFFDNQLLGDKILGYQVIANIQQCYTPERIVRILGAEAVRRPEDSGVKVYNQLSNMGQQIDRVYQVADRALKAEYDYVVDRSPQSVTIRSEQFKNLMEAAKIWNVNGVEIIPADVIVDKSDLPESDKARIKQNIEMQRARMGMGPMGPSGMMPPGMNGPPMPPPNGQVPQ